MNKIIISILTLFAIALGPAHGYAALSTNFDSNPQKSISPSNKVVQGILLNIGEGQFCSVITEDTDQDLVPSSYQVTASNEKIREALLEYEPCDLQDIAVITQTAEIAHEGPIKLASCSLSL